MQPQFTPKQVASFWQKVDRSGGPGSCWVWTASRHASGYGTFRMGPKILKAHRVAWMLSNGAIGEGLYVCHHCDNPSCVNPAHLFVGTPADNSQDREAKGRRAAVKGSEHGMAKLTESAVQDILRRLAAGERQKSIAEIYGVDFTLVSMIKRDLIWRHVPRPRSAPR